MSEEAKKPKVERVMVHLRIRPLSEDDMSRSGSQLSIEYTDDSRGIVVIRKDYDKKTFNFDSVFDASSRQEDVYTRVASPVVSSVIEGYNGTIFSYGQTGTGKTFTMIGGSGDQQGVIPRSAQQIFNYTQSSKTHAFVIKVGFLQIYMEMLQDLICPDVEKQIRIREDPDIGVYLSGITWTPVGNTKNCMDLMYMGDRNRNTAFTSMNSHSSRSHAVYMIRIEKRVKYTGEELEELEKKGEKPDQSMTNSVLYLVDLAGSERVSKSKAAGNRLDEAKNINLGLLALGNCIQALADKKSKYVPFRDSKLTRLLEDSLGGNSKTSLVVTIGPSIGHYQESLSSLLFGTRAMKVENRPELNITIDYKSLCSQLQAELDRINDSNSMWTIEKQQLLQTLSNTHSEIDNLNSEKLELQLMIDQLRSKRKDLNTIEKDKQEELLKIKSNYKEQFMIKENEYKKTVEDYDKSNNELEQILNHSKVQVLDYETKNNNLKHELKKYVDELEQEKNDRKIRTTQMNAEIEELQKALNSEKSKSEKQVAMSIVDKSEGIAKYEEIVKNNEENCKRTIEEYETDLNILKDNLSKLSVECGELGDEKKKLLQKLGSLTKKASHIAKESVRIRSETENYGQSVKILRDRNDFLTAEISSLSKQLENKGKEKEDLIGNVKGLSRLHQEMINNEKTKTAQLKFITEEIYMTMRNMERFSMRFQEKLLYFITQKSQIISSIQKDSRQIVLMTKEKSKNAVSEKQEIELKNSEIERIEKEIQEFKLN